MTTESLYVPDLPPALKHPTVFKKFDSLKNGEGFILINDHDPIPLYYELKAERGGVFEWRKLESGPALWKVEIIKNDERSESKPTEVSFEQQPKALNEDIFILNVTLLEPRLKHPTIFKYFDASLPGGAFEILNDHDPKPLYYQLIAERGNTFSWTYLEKGPVWWRVQIKKNLVEASESVGQIAAKDLRKAEVFKSYGIDFCCGGKKSLKEACAEKGINMSIVEEALKQAESTKPQGEQYTRWNADFLADYIYNKHHLYYYEVGPVILDLLTKVINRHGAHYSQLQEVYKLYTKLTEELNEHFHKEEQILFPFIKALSEAKRSGDKGSLGSQFSMVRPILMMEKEHDAAGGILEQLQQVTDHYTAPAGACNSFQFLYQKIKELDEDLHQHIHLENNVLFPRVLALEKELRD